MTACSPVANPPVMDVGAPAPAALHARLATLDEVLPTWEALLAHPASREQVYLGPEWAKALSAAFAGQGTPHFLAFENEGGLVGLAPLWFRPRFGLGILTFLGSGPRDYSLADYQRLLAAPEHEAAAVEAFGDWLARRELPWHVVSLLPIPADSFQPAALTAQGQRHGWRVRRRGGGTSYLIPLPETWADYLASLPTNLRQQLPRQLRKLAREHNARWERVQSPAELPQALADLRRLHTRRWRARGQPGLLDDHVFRFVRRLAEQLLPTGHLELVRLRLDGEVRAAILNFRYGDTALFYLSGFDPDPAWSRYSLGNLLIAHSIQEAISDGCRWFDLLRGDEAYKPRFGGQPAPNGRVIIYRSEAAYVAYRLLAKLDRVAAWLAIRRGQ